MTQHDDQEHVPYSERSLPEIILLAKSYFGTKAVAYAVGADQIEKLDELASGSSDPSPQEDKTLRDLAATIEIHEDRGMSPLQSTGIMIGSSWLLDQESPLRMFRQGESQRVLELMPGIIQDYIGEC
jgi:hypothetical protein